MVAIDTESFITDFFTKSRADRSASASHANRDCRTPRRVEIASRRHALYHCERQPKQAGGFVDSLPWRAVVDRDAYRSLPAQGRTRHGATRLRFECLPASF